MCELPIAKKNGGDMMTMAIRFLVWAALPLHIVPPLNCQMERPPKTSASLEESGARRRLK